MYEYYKHPMYPQVQIVKIPFSSIEKIDFALCNQPTETPDKFYARQTVKPDIITNGGFYTQKTGLTCFGFTDEGLKINGTTDKGVGITEDNQLLFGHIQNLPNIRDYVEAYPILIEDGAAVSTKRAADIDYLARRTAIGWNKEFFFIMTVDSPGLRFDTVQKLFLELKADYAINLDGGGSTRMLIDGKRKTSQSYARPVDNVMCVYLKKNKQEKVLWRVQTGAFTKKENADRLAQELIKKGFKDIWVRKIGCYWKVQLGAFSVKLNAERLADRLQDAGYKTYITNK